MDFSSFVVDLLFSLVNFDLMVVFRNIVLVGVINVCSLLICVGLVSIVLLVLNIYRKGLVVSRFSLCNVVVFIFVVNSVLLVLSICWVCSVVL